MHGPTAEELRLHAGPARVVQLAAGGHYPHVVAAAAFADQLLSATALADA